MSHQKALKIAEELRDTDHWSDVIRAFTETHPVEYCSDCGNQLELTFVPLAMLYLKFCKTCADKRDEKERQADEKGKADYKKRVKNNIQSYLESKASVPKLFASKVGALQKGTDSRKGYFIYGKVGRGKTQLSVNIMAAVFMNAEPFRVERGIYALSVRGAYITMPAFLREIKGTFDEGADQSESEVIEKYAGVDVLILDDLGVEKFTEWSQEKLYELLDARYAAMRQTIITSNFDLDQLAGLTHDRITSRISEMCTVKKMGGNDRRLNK
jgi:DNA replication protein DnaC